MRYERATDFVKDPEQLRRVLRNIHHQLNQKDLPMIDPGDLSKAVRRAVHEELGKLLTPRGTGQARRVLSDQGYFRPGKKGKKQYFRFMKKAEKILAGASPGQDDAGSLVQSSADQGLERKKARPIHWRDVVKDPESIRRILQTVSSQVSTSNGPIRGSDLSRAIGLALSDELGKQVDNFQAGQARRMLVKQSFVREVKKNGRVVGFKFADEVIGKLPQTTASADTRPDEHKLTLATESPDPDRLLEEAQPFVEAGRKIDAIRQRRVELRIRLEEEDARLARQEKELRESIPEEASIAAARLLALVEFKEE